jgi:hypothetical protein
MLFFQKVGKNLLYLGDRQVRTDSLMIESFYFFSSKKKVLLSSLKGSHP